MLVQCPKCFGQCSAPCPGCEGQGCEVCAYGGKVMCSTCRWTGKVEEPLHCPKCGRHHGGPLIGWGLDELHELRREPCASCAIHSDPRDVPEVPPPSIDEPGADTSSEATAPGSTPDRIDSVRRRWASDAKPCGRCGHDVLWRYEDGRRVALNESGSEHACP